MQTWEEVRLRLLAAKKRGDQKTIAVRLGVDDSTVTRFLQGKQPPSFEAVRVMAEVIGVSVVPQAAAAPAPAAPELPADLAEKIKGLVSEAVAEALSQYGGTPPPKRPPRSKSGERAAVKRGSR